MEALAEQPLVLSAREDGQLAPPQPGRCAPGTLTRRSGSPVLHPVGPRHRPARGEPSALDAAQARGERVAMATGALPPSGDLVLTPGRPRPKKGIGASRGGFGAGEDKSPARPAPSGFRLNALRLPPRAPPARRRSAASLGGCVGR